jgi:hypothetical protein
MGGPLEDLSLCQDLGTLCQLCGTCTQLVVLVRYDGTIVLSEGWIDMCPYQPVGCRNDGIWRLILFGRVLWCGTPTGVSHRS